MNTEAISVKNWKIAPIFEINDDVFPLFFVIQWRYKFCLKNSIHLIGFESRLRSTGTSVFKLRFYKYFIKTQVSSVKTIHLFNLNYKMGLVNVWTLLYNMHVSWSKCRVWLDNGGTWSNFSFDCWINRLLLKIYWSQAFRERRTVLTLRFIMNILSCKETKRTEIRLSFIKSPPRVTLADVSYH